MVFHFSDLGNYSLVQIQIAITLNGKTTGTLGLEKMNRALLSEALGKKHGKTIIIEECGEHLSLESRGDSLNNNGDNYTF